MEGKSTGMGKMPERGKKAGGAVRRILALGAALALAGLYVASFVLAVLGHPGAAGVLRFTLGMTVFLPLFIWVVTWCMGVMLHRHSFASLDLFHSNPEERRRMEEGEVLLKKQGKKP